MSPIRWRVIRWIFLVAGLLSLTGCWDRRETPELAIVGSIGLDAGDEGRVLVSLEVIHADALARGPGPVSVPSKVVAWVFREEGRTVLNAIRNVETRTSRRMFVGQVNTVIFGQNLARQGIRRYLDVFERQSQFRRSLILNVCDTGAGLLQRPLIEDIPSRTLSGQANTALYAGKTVVVTLNEFLRTLAEPGIEPVTSHTAGRQTRDAMVKRLGESVRQKNPSVMRPQPFTADEMPEGELPPDSPVLDPLREAGTGEEMEGITVVPGIAVFRGDRLVGFLDGAEARGYLWAAGRIRGAILEIPSPLPGIEVLALEVIRVQSSIEPQISGQKIRIKVTIGALLEISEVPVGFVMSQDTVGRIEEAANEFIRREVYRTLRRVQREYKSDIYGFGQAVYRKDPRLWRRLEDDWNRHIFPHLEVQVQVRSNIRSSALLLRDPR